ncbi:GNAT family N-acetyltransferase [Anaerocolumna sp. AGMB13025]|uniref:GNAT family N-acetyltransferase n=1 Tax=Anaerocolumna sp. AGMB13025 TaxID=3039116 RepID=UPI00241E5E8D|nr:GNAT family N-acetyltransferase [Anaerocolumna sp. AGMB13025]WFR59991.1 GNAT family N-acetyltransferase [Anaerocolumna sp. AGMB13025]
MGITLKTIDIVYCDYLAELLNSDENLYLALTPNSPRKNITGNDYYVGCKEWEVRKNGSNFVILYNERPIGSISFYKRDDSTAGCGYWIESLLWGKGYGKEAFSLFLPIIKNAGFEYVTANILKSNEASLKIWTKYTTDIKENEDRYAPIICLK